MASKRACNPSAAAKPFFILHAVCTCLTHIARPFGAVRLNPVQLLQAFSRDTRLWLAV